MEEEKLYLNNDFGISYRSGEKKTVETLLYTAETVECSVMLVFFIAVTVLILIFPGISSVVLSTYIGLRESGVKEIFTDMIIKMKQVI